MNESKENYRLQKERNKERKRKHSEIRNNF